MFFGRATRGLSGFFSTHPPLAVRIRRIEPSWDGTLPEGPPVASAHPPAAAGVAAFAGPATVDQIGQPAGEAHLQYAARLVKSLPAQLVSAAHEPHGARALVCALLLDREAAPRQRQLAHLAGAADPGVYEETLRLMPLVGGLDVQARLPLLDISLPALRALVPAQYDRFKQNVVALVQADNEIDLFEWSLHRILLHDLEAHFVKRSSPRVRHHTLASVRPHSELLLSMLAYAGHRDLDSAGDAFAQARRSLELPEARLRPVDDLHFAALDAALAALEEAAPLVKRQVLRAAVACITADRTMTATEAELLRAISASLGCPMPPLLLA